mmetsp:Transcript_3029/g.12557  ORF Transcript_3029/g.12557 Transcript_3029/m.12557 type:complete len:214 (+) Transcript_3029:2195-2836(+)
MYSKTPPVCKTRWLRFFSWTRTRRWLCSWTGGTSRRQRSSQRTCDAPRRIPTRPRGRRRRRRMTRQISRPVRGKKVLRRRRVYARARRTTCTCVVCSRRTLLTNCVPRTETRRRLCSRSSTRRSSARSCAKPKVWTCNERCASSRRARRRRVARRRTRRLRFPKRLEVSLPKTTECLSVDKTTWSFPVFPSHNQLVPSGVKDRLCLRPSARRC